MIKNKNGIIQKICAVVVLLLILNFFFACSIYYFEREMQPETFGSIRAAMWYIFVTLTTVGYADVYPLTFGGKLINILTAVIGTLSGIVCFIWMVSGTLKLGTFLRKTRLKITKS